jgi:hypothetical protein
MRSSNLVMHSIALAVSMHRSLPINMPNTPVSNLAYENNKRKVIYKALSKKLQQQNYTSDVGHTL